MTEGTPKSVNTNEMLKKKLTPLQLSECREAFDMHDEDMDGVISTQVVVSALRAFGYRPNKPVMDKIKQLDMENEDGIGKLKYDNFLDLVCQQIRYSFTSEDLLEDLKAIDVNDDGKISKEELRKYLESLQIPFSDEELDEIVNDADLDNDSAIDYREFVIMMCPDGI